MHRILEPTEKQIEILQFMVEYAKDNDNFPSSHEVSEATNISQPRAYEHLLCLVDKGYVEQRGRGRVKHWRLIEGKYIPPQKLESVGIII